MRGSVGVEIGFVFEKQLLAVGGWLLALFCIFMSPCGRVVYVRPPLMHEAACLVRKKGGFMLCGIA